MPSDKAARELIKESLSAIGIDSKGFSTHSVTRQILVLSGGFSKGTSLLFSRLSSV